MLLVENSSYFGAKFPEIPRKKFPGVSGSNISQIPRGIGDGEFRGPALDKIDEIVVGKIYTIDKINEIYIVNDATFKSE